MNRPGGTRELDKQIAAIIGWTEIGEYPGVIDVFGIPPGGMKAEPLPFYSSVRLLACWAAETFKKQGGILEEPLPSEPWIICEQIIQANRERTKSVQGTQ